MPLLFIFLVFLLPAVEVYLLFSWIASSPWIALPYLLVTVVLGVGCIKLAKVGMGECLRRLQGMRQSGGYGAASLRMLLIFGKMWVIGILLCFPGYITDIMAAVIWLWSSRRRQEAVNREIQADAHIIDEPQDRGK